MTLLATLGYAVPGRSRRWRIGWLVRPLDEVGPVEAAIRRGLLIVGQLVAGGCDPRHCHATGSIVDDRRPACVLAGVAARASVDQPLRGRADVRRARAAGTWIGIQNGLGNVSGIVGPIVTGVLIDCYGYDSAFHLAAAVAVFGALWWAFVVPRIAPVRQHA